MINEIFHLLLLSLQFGSITTMIYTHVVNQGGKGVRSPAELI